jgi:deoxycytidylate deaminase
VWGGINITQFFEANMMQVATMIHQRTHGDRVRVGAAMLEEHSAVPLKLACLAI